MLIRFIVYVLLVYFLIRGIKFLIRYLQNAGNSINKSYRNTNYKNSNNNFGNSKYRNIEEARYTEIKSEHESGEVKQSK